jgi:Tfp pilus assembly protein PilF
MLVPVAVWAAWKGGNRDALLITLTFVLIYSAGNVLFFMSDRYRYPIWPATAALAGGGLLALSRMIQVRDVRAASCAVSSMLLVAGISLPNWAGIKLPSFARDYLFRSIAWYEKGHLREALDDINRSLDLDPADASALQQRGNVLFALDQPVQAKESFQQALKLSPGEGVTWNNLGVANERLGDTNAAIVAFRAATQCKPPSRNAFVNLACIQIRSGMFTDTGQTLASLEKITPGPDATTVSLASILARHAGDSQQADALEAKARSLDSSTAAWVLERAGQASATQVH